MGTNFNYDDTSHQVIFDHINGGVGSESLQQAGQAWQQLGDAIGQTGKSFVQSAIGGILTTREGAAAEAATAAIGALLPWIDDVAVITAAAAQRSQGQADYWVTAKNNVPPVPPAPQSSGFFGDPGGWFVEKMDWFPGVTSEEEKAQQGQQDAAEQARQAMRVYQSSSNGNIDQAPAFTAPQGLNGSIGALPLTGAHLAGAGAAAAPATAIGGGAAVHQAHLMAADQPSTYQPAATVSQLAQGGQAPPGNVAPGQFAANPTPTQGASSGLLPVGAGFGGTTTGREPVRAAPGRSAMAGAASAGATRGGGGGGAGFGPRPSTGLGPAVRAPHPFADETNGSRASAGMSAAARGGGGAGYGAPFAGGAGQRGEQDREHRSKYLVHDDSHAIVGDLPPTAPPVIGEDY
ncbi:MAG: PPE domain-containing protein [Pseudonocardiaceae bacterium]